MPRKPKKKAEPAQTEEALPRLREPDEPALKAPSEADIETGTEVPARSETSVASHPAEAEAVAEAADTFEQAFEDREPPEHPATVPIDLQASDADENDRETQTEPSLERPPARLERLQKILSQAGVASRRHAEEMIVQGRVQVNGQIITELGSKADPGRDHIRVDGKLLRGAERLRYFVLNKPKGYVTTVSDPEGRPTVMQFFQKLRERLYPVGRLDYQTEGLLLVTNDGDLANKLTRPATGVQRTYLVKVSGQPGADALVRLREGLAIDRGRPGEGRVHTSPADIREVRQGDNPWFEVVLTEGRNRELRKMFEEVGHHVEKIRRVEYGPLVLDLEPGRFRELEPEEVARLRLAADGKWRKPKPKPKERDRGPKERDRGPREFTRRPPEERQRHAPKPAAPRDRQWGRENRGEGRGETRPPINRPPYGRNASSTRPTRPAQGGPPRRPDRELRERPAQPPRENWRPRQDRGPSRQRPGRPPSQSARADTRSSPPRRPDRELRERPAQPPRENWRPRQDRGPSRQRPGRPPSQAGRAETRSFPKRTGSRPDSRPPRPESPRPGNFRPSNAKGRPAGDGRRPTQARPGRTRSSRPGPNRPGAPRRKPS